MGRTPLHLAAGSGRIKLLEYLLQLGNSTPHISKHPE